MASVPADPYRTLGLRPGAGPAEVKRAYRRLVKEVHPDFAGPASLPRFLAIQAAYEALVGADLSAPGAGSARPDGAASPRGRDDGPRHGPGGAAGWGSSRPGGRAGDPEGARGEPWRRGPRPAWQADPDRAQATWDEARRAGSRAGSRVDEDAAGRAKSPGRGPGSTRPAKRATFGSTTYDGAEAGDPQWSGAGWYGTGSGTYWTLNPREYADPRKHGPEYQARARALADEERRAAAAGATAPGSTTTASGATAATPADASPDEPAMGPASTRSAEGTGASADAPRTSTQRGVNPEPAGWHEPGVAADADAEHPGILDRLRRTFFG